MHTLHGSTAIVSVPGATTGVTNGPPSTLSRKQRYSSRSNSLSSASVVTVKRTGSRSSSSTGVRTSAGPVRSHSPGDPSSLAQRLGRDPMSQEHRRRQSVAVDVSERPDGEGLGNLHRWSQSTNGSVRSTSQTASRVSSGAVLPSIPTQPFSPHRKTRSIVDHSPRPSPHRRKTSSRPASRRRQSSGSPELERRPDRPEFALPLTALPPLHTTPALTDPNDTESPSTIPVSTPTNLSSYGPDYFGEDGNSPRSKAKSKKPILIRNHTASMSTSNATRLQAVEGAEDTSNSREESRDTEMEEVNGSALRSNYAEPVENHEPVRPPTAGESSRQRRSGHTRDKSEREKKAMLSKALQKANTAVLLDNAQNFEGALEAYSDACRLLQQVMDRTSTVEDKRKLDSIRVTYTNRVEELRQLEAAQPDATNEKSLPTRPMSDDSSLLQSPVSGLARTPSIGAQVSASPTIETASSAQQVEVPKLSYPEKDRDSFFSGTMRAVETSSQQVGDARPDPISIQPVHDVEARQGPVEDESPVLARGQASTMREDAQRVGARTAPDMPPLNVDGLHIPPSNSRYMPAPLSPRRPSIPDIKPQIEEEPEEVPPLPQQPVPADDQPAEDSNASGSWLDPIDESDSSCASSVHSVSSQQGIHRKHIRGASGDTNPDFDAAFDAAVEAAYNEGFEPDLDGTRTVEPAATRHAAKPSLVVPSSEIKEILSPTNSYHPNTTMDLGLDDEEEERILDDITQDYAQTFNFDLSTKSALPRQSDSSGYSRSTWQSSQTSDRTTAGTSLSTVAEDTASAPAHKNAFAASTSLNTVLGDHPPPPLTAPPPQASLPRLPTATQNRNVGVRSRRLSGQKPKDLKIETAAQVEAHRGTAKFQHAASPFKEEDEDSARDDVSKDSSFGSDLQPTISVASEQHHQHLLASPPSLDMLSAVSDRSRPNTATTVTTEQRRSIDDMPGELSGTRPAFMKKNQSSVSLREHTVIMASPTEPPVALTPMSSTYMTFASKRQNEAPITTQRAQLPTYAQPHFDSQPGGFHLFDTSLTTTKFPGSPRSPTSGAAVLEPCPESYLLRPFWLMRAMGLTLTHPKGGFLTSRLFVPREVWQTKGVKLKSIDEKIANCDLLVAALGRLAGVDTYDADALMEELQNFEEVMERVQTSLVKKLGSDVGIGGMAGLFKDAAAAAASSTGMTSTSTSTPNADIITLGGEKTKSKEGKGYLNSWRKLRSKSSGTPISAGQGANKAFNKIAEKELPSMQSVPMTSYVPVERRGMKKDARNLSFEGPNKEYMASLARLFEGAQVLGKFLLFLLISWAAPDSISRLGLGGQSSEHDIPRPKVSIVIGVCGFFGTSRIQAGSLRTGFFHFHHHRRNSKIHRLKTSDHVTRTVFPLTLYAIQIKSRDRLKTQVSRVPRRRTSASN